MKLRKKHIGFVLIGSLIFVVISTPLVSNLWGLLTGNGFIIPKESSVLTFKVTKMNQGSGEYWLYGEDKTYFYSQMIKGDHEPYIKYPKEKATLKEEFDKFNYQTWSDKIISKKNLDNILHVPLSEIDSVKIYPLIRISMEEYKKGRNFYKLNKSEIHDLTKQLRDSTNFYGGTPLMFGFTSGITFYFKEKTNTLWVSPNSWKLLQQDFEISYNKIQKLESVGASYFPFIKEEFALFLKNLEQKLK